MIGRSLIVLMVFIALRSNPVFSCSCALPNDPNYWVNKAPSILAVMPVEASYEDTGRGHGVVSASVQLLDVLKGPRPEVLPRMQSHRQVIGESSCGNPEISLGAVYIVYLDNINQEVSSLSSCSSSTLFRYTRYAQELYCFKGHPERESQCAPKLLRLLRGASSANERFGYDEDWLDRSRNTISAEIQQMRERALRHAQQVQ